MPEAYLHGLAFHAADVILGNEGYLQFRTERGVNILPGQDGSYVTANSDETGSVIGTDFNGYHKLFLYRHQNHWAASNSLIELAKFASNKRLPVTIDEAHLSSFFIRGNIGNQLASLHTSVKEITLVPSNREIFIPFSGEPVVRETEQSKRAAADSRAYSDILGEYLSIWTKRLRVLLDEKMVLRSGLTGGKDSRIVLAMFLASDRRIPGNATFFCAEHAKEDLAVAQVIADQFGLSFNQKEIGAPTIGGGNAYEAWKALCLGVYTPIYMPAQAFNSTHIYLGGAGGETHRRFYKDGTIEALLNRTKRHFPSAQRFVNFREDVLSDLHSLRVGIDANVDPLIVHYRHFRDRMHGGRTSQYLNTVTPLGGRLLKQASSALNPRLLERGQVLADILLNCAPDLANMPYDEAYKTLDLEHYRNFKKVTIDTSIPGKVFRKRPEDRPEPDRGASAMRLLAADFHEKVEIARRLGFFPQAYIAEAETVMREARKAGRLPHATHGIAISHIMLAAELDEL